MKTLINFCLFNLLSKAAQLSDDSLSFLDHKLGRLDKQIFKGSGMVSLYFCGAQILKQFKTVFNCFILYNVNLHG